MEKSGFFNAVLNDGVYDRTYNANDYSENLAVVISNGVLRSPNNDLKVTANGLICTVATGRAWIKGHYYRNDTAMTLTPTAVPVGGSRYDYIILRYDNSIAERKISVKYIQGEASNSPVRPTIIRNDTIYDLVLAEIYITANASTMSVTDKRSNSELCGWVFSTSGDNSFFESLDGDFYEWFEEKKDTLSSVTLFKRYTWSTTITSVTSIVTFNIPQYNEETSFIEVYVNGILENAGTDYTLLGSTITFDGELIAGAVVTVKCYKSIDGTGIETVADEITTLQNQMEAVQGNAKFTYVCTGANDNISLSQIAQAIATGSYVVSSVNAAAAAFLERLGGNEYLASLASDAQVEIDIVGNCGVSTHFAGDGTAASPKRYFSLGLATSINKRIIFDFAKCDKINVLCWDNSTNIIFYGNNLNIKNVNIRAYATHAGSNITMIKGGANNGRVNFENCRMIIEATGSAMISENGTFTNCYCWIRSNASTAYCFKPRSTGLIRLIGGEFYAYGLTTSGISSAITHTSAGDTDGVLLAYNIHCPVVTVANYTQGFLSVANAGSTIINGVVSRLTSSGTYNTITGLVNKNKA